MRYLRRFVHIVFADQRYELVILDVTSSTFFSIHQQAYVVIFLFRCDPRPAGGAADWCDLYE